MIESGRSEKDDDQFQGALNADEADDASQQPADAQGFGLDLGSLLGGLMGGQTTGRSMPDQMDPAGAQAGGLDLGSLLGGLLGGMGGGQMGGMPDMSGQMGGTPGMGGSPLDGILGGVAGDLSAKTGLPKEIITMGAMFLISKLMSGGLGGNSQSGGQSGGLDIGAILGGLLGGGGMPGLPGMDQGLPQQDAGGLNTPQGGEVLGKIGKQINDGLNSPGLTAGGMQQNGLASEFAEMSGMNEDEAAQSLSQIVDALKQSGLSQ
jgi:hypothetical protein